MKYLFPDGKVDTIERDQEISKKCYVESFKLKKVREICMNIMDTIAKPPWEASAEECLTIREEATWRLEKKIFSRETITKEMSII